MSLNCLFGKIDFVIVWYNALGIRKLENMA